MILLGTHAPDGLCGSITSVASGALGVMSIQNVCDSFPLGEHGCKTK